MLNYSICTDCVYSSLDTVESIKDVKNHGFNSIEFWGWWNKDMDAVIKTTKELDMNIAAFCTKFISMIDPNTAGDYLEGLKASVEIAQKAGTKILISQVGATTTASREAQIELLKETMLKSSAILKGTGVTLAIEPLNTKRNHPGYFLEKSDEAFGIISDVNADEIKILFDIYHQQITEGDILTSVKNNLDKIAHVHAAGIDSRSELNKSEIDYKYVLNEIVKLGFTGYIGLEYKPSCDMKIGFDIAKSY